MKLEIIVMILGRDWVTLNAIKYDEYVNLLNKISPRIFTFCVFHLKTGIIVPCPSYPFF